MAALKLEDLIKAQMKMAAQGDEIAKRSLARLQELEKTAKRDQIIQLAELAEQRMSQKDEDKIVETLDDGLTKKTGDGLNANVIKLTKEIREALKTKPEAQRPEGKPTDTTGAPGRVIAGTRDPEKARLEQAAKANAAQYQRGFGDVLKDFKNKFTLKGMFDLSEGKSQGMLGTIVRNKVAENEYVKNQMTINPQMANLKQFGGDTKKVEEYWRGKYKEQQSVKREQVRTETRIEELRNAGYSEDEIARAGLLKERREQDDALAAVDKRYDKAREAERAEIKETTKAGKAAAKASAASKPSVEGKISTGDFSLQESGSETARIVAEDSAHLKAVADNTAEMVKLFRAFSTAKPEGTEAAKKEDEGGIDLPDIDIDLRRKGRGLGRAAKGLAKRAAGALRSGAAMLGRGAAAAVPYAAPAAIAYGAANAVDWGAGKLGVGKDAEGNDLKIDEAQDTVNWNRMTWWQKAQSGLARGIEKTGSFVGLDNIAREAQASRMKSETEYLDKTVGKQRTWAEPTEKAPMTSKSTETYMIANQPVGEKLSQQQMSVMEMSMKMGNSYPPEVMAKYNAQKSQQASPTAAPAAAATPTAPTPRSADQVYGKSSENAAASQQAGQGAATGPSNTVVNAPTVINNTTTPSPRPPARNTESSWQRYNMSKYAMA